MRWQPYQEPLRSVLLRTGLIAFAVGAVARSLTIGIIALWPSLGGHFVEVWFLNWLRPRLPLARTVQTVARVATWFVAGSLLIIAMQRTWEHLVLLLGVRLYYRYLWPWWLGGVVFIGIELIAHLGLMLFRRPNFYNCQG